MKPGEAAPTAAIKNRLETAKETGNFNIILAAVKAAGLAETLNGAGPFTVFVPTDEAFAKLAKADLDRILADKITRKAALTYHVVAGDKLAADVTSAKELTSVQGDALAIDATASVKLGAQRFHTTG